LRELCEAAQAGLGGGKPFGTQCLSLRGRLRERISFDGERDQHLQEAAEVSLFEPEASMGLCDALQLAACLFLAAGVFEQMAQAALQRSFDGRILGHSAAASASSEATVSPRQPSRSTSLAIAVTLVSSKQWVMSRRAGPTGVPP
jgi:hypothetical protein